MHKFIFYILLTLLPALSVANECVSPFRLQKRTVIVEKYGRGVGNGVLLDNQTLLTAYHVVKDIDKIWIRLPDYGELPYPARIVRYDQMADIALLALDKPLLKSVDPLPVMHGEQIYRDMRVFLASHAQAERSRFGVVEGTYVAPARLAEGAPVTAIYIELKERTYGGDSGAGVFNCYGELMGIEVGNMADQGRPNHIAAVSPSYLQWILLPRP